MSTNLPIRVSSKVLFILFGIIVPALIGLLHTWVHFTDLVTAEVQDSLSVPVTVMGQTPSAFNTWGLMSFMMGLSFVVIALLNLALLRGTPKDKMPSLLAIVAMLLYLGSVIYAGRTFSALPQYYLGIVGFIVMLFCFGVTVRDQMRSTP